MAAAEQARGRYVRLADRAARFYAPAVHILGLVTFLGWLLAGQGWEAALTVAIAVLIITCPCALALAVPAVQVAATSRLFGKGVLVKAADGLERLAEVDTVVFDKTGTLTLGEPALAHERRRHRRRPGARGRLAAASRHPYARAVVRAAEAAGLADRASRRRARGRGLRARARGRRRHRAAGLGGLVRRRGAGRRRGGASGIAPPTAPRSALHFEDRLRPDAADVVARLHEAGFHTELLSGDRHAVVEAAAIQSGIGRWTAGALPGAEDRPPRGAEGRRAARC